MSKRSRQTGESWVTLSPVVVQECQSRGHGAGSKILLFIRLGCITCRPVLRIRRLFDGSRDGDGLGDRRAAVAVLLALHGKFDGEAVHAQKVPVVCPSARV